MNNITSVQSMLKVCVCLKVIVETSSKVQIKERVLIIDNTWVLWEGSVEPPNCGLTGSFLLIQDAKLSSN